MPILYMSQTGSEDMAMGSVRLLQSVRQNCSAISRVHNVRVLNVVHSRDFSVSPSLQ